MELKIGDQVKLMRPGSNQGSVGVVVAERMVNGRQQATVVLDNGGKVEHYSYDLQVLPPAAQLDALHSVPMSPPSNLVCGFTQPQLKAAFDAVCDKTDWKAPVYAWVGYRELAVTLLAIEFFTGTVGEVRESKNHGRDVLVHAHGYRNGPCGP